MGSTSYLTKSKLSGYRAKSGSSVGSDKEINGKLRKSKVRRPKMDYGLKRVPDYTELAYKEAVSKLRYFLSGNYAPSIRSYGGSASIKNLDESDGDQDKKYLDKPRPRLTAKYATLYADSLRNYNPPHTAVPAAAAPADLAGGTNPDVVHFIQKQEEYIEQLERESQYCRDELNNLLGKVKEVISENEHLHEAQKNKIISRMFHSHGSETDDLDDAGDSTGVDSDHKASTAKSRRPKTRSSKLEGPNIVFESRIAELEAQLTQAKIDLKKVQEENNENKRKLASGLVDSTCLDGFKRQIDNLQRDKSSLEAQVSKLKTLQHEAPRADAGQLRDERRALEDELRRLKEDLSAERAKVRELVGEGSRRAIQERSAAEQRYNAHFDSLQHELAAQYDTVAKLQLDLERQRREESELKRELSMKNSALEELKMELKGKTSSLQADLTQAIAEKASLEEELASARLAIERHQRQAKHEVNRLNSEIQSLRQRLDRADADLVHSRRENLRLSEQIATLEKELNMKSLTPNSPEKNKKEKEMSSMLESIENKHAKTVAELESMIHSQNSLMEKLTGECRLLTDKLDDASRRHKAELATLQRQVDCLGRSLQPTAPSARPAPASHLPAADRNPPNTADSGSDLPGPDSPGHPDQPRGTRDQGRALSKQPSRTVKQAPTTEPKIEVEQDRTEASQSNTSVMEHDGIASDVNAQDFAENPVLHSQAFNEPIGQVDQNQEQYHNPVHDYNTSDQNYQEKTEPYYAGQDQQGYDQNYQQNYQEGQFENNEQYPQQQYTDPNAQYTDPNAQYTDPNAQYTDPNTQYTEGQYDNYATDGTYQQEYDPTQYVEPDTQYESQNASIEQEIAPSDGKRSNSPAKGQG